MTVEVATEQVLVNTLDDVVTVQLVAEISTVVVDDTTVAIEVVAESVQTVEIVAEGMQGPRGEQGIPGPPGASAPPAAAEFNFPVPADTWIAVHNLGFTPSVMTYDSVGRQQRGVVTENTASRTVVSYYFPVAGRMTLS